MICDIGYFLAPAQDACFPCPQGNSCPNGVTKAPCDVGSFQNQTGQAQCLACPFGSVQGKPEQSECIACLGASFVPVSSVSRTTCTPMSKGHFGVVLEGSLGFSSQAPCPRGSKCVDGVRIDCPAGSYQSASTSEVCIPCASNTFSSVVGRTSPCEALPVGSFTNDDRSANLGPCPPGFYCLEGLKYPCGLGTFQDIPGQIACKPCGLGYYNDVAARNVSCVPIPIGYYGVGGTAQTRRGTAPCQPGFYCSAGVSQVCGASTYQPSGTQGSCVPCSNQCVELNLTWKNKECNSLTGENTCIGTDCQPIALCSHHADITPPSISLNGLSPMYHEAGLPFADPGVVVVDAFDLNPITSKPVSNVNTLVPGTYNISYGASDHSSNANTVRLLLLLCLAVTLVAGCAHGHRSGHDAASHFPEGPAIYPNHPGRSL